MPMTSGSTLQRHTAQHQQHNISAVTTTSHDSSRSNWCSHSYGLLMMTQLLLLEDLAPGVCHVNGPDPVPL